MDDYYKNIYCPECKGSGHIIDNNDKDLPCLKCAGTGILTIQERKKLSIVEKIFYALVITIFVLVSLFFIIYNILAAF